MSIDVAELDSTRFLFNHQMDGLVYCELKPSVEYEDVMIPSHKVLIIIDLLGIEENRVLNPDGSVAIFCPMNVRVLVKVEVGL